MNVQRNSNFKHTSKSLTRELLGELNKTVENKNTKKQKKATASSKKHELVNCIIQKRKKKWFRAQTREKCSVEETKQPTQCEKREKEMLNE